MGLSPIMVEKIFEVVRDDLGAGHDGAAGRAERQLALQAANRGYVMDSGLITMTGDAADCWMIRRCGRRIWANKARMFRTKNASLRRGIFLSAKLQRSGPPHEYVASRRYVRWPTLSLAPRN